jgi:nitrous oxidase accessory protein NosD
MKSKLITLSTLLILLISTIPFYLQTKPVEASITGPSLIVDDTVNQIHATLGAGAGSVVTVKGTVTNLAYPGPPPLLTGVFYRENVGPGITPPDLTIFWSPDGIAWLPAGPIWCPTAYPGYQLELIIGGGGYWLPLGGSSTVYIKTIANRPLGPTDVEVIVFVDSIANSKYDPGESILTIPPPAYDFPVKIDLSIWNTAELDPATFFSTIQAAINAATPGQTIYVYPGTYNENLVVNKALTIQGADKETTIIQAQPVSPYGGDIAIEIKASNVAISGFDISGYAATQAKPGSTYWGVYAYGSSSSHYSNINVTDSVFTFLSQSGIQLGYVDGSLIRDNIFKRETRLVWYKPPGTPPGSYINVTRGGAGPALWYCTNVTIDPNVIQTDGVGIFLSSSSDVSIEANVISAPDTANPSDVGIHVQSCTGISIVGNNVFNYTAGSKSGYNWGTNGAGVNILGSQSINVRNNSLHDNTVGVLVQRLDLAPEPRKVDIHYNNFENNAEFGVLNCYTWIGKNQTYTPASYVADARFNWWGDSSGPTHSSNLGGIGDAITDNVDYSPWLGFVVGTSPMTWHVNPTGGSDAIQEAIDEASDGDTIIAHAGTYYESQIIVDKSLKVLGSGADTTVIDGGNVALSNVGLVRITANTGNVTFSGFTVKNAGPAGTVRVVIYAASGTAGPTYTISNNKIYGTNTDDPDDYGFYSHGGKERLIFTNNLITQTGSNPILLEQHTGETEASYNILDEGFYGSTVYFSMTYGGLNITTPQKVHHNTIDVGTGFHTGSDYYGGGITFNSASHYGTGNGTYTSVQITDNVISNMKGYRRGISLRNDASGDGSGGEISSPIIERNIITGIVGETENTGIRLTGLVTDATVSDNNITCTYLGVFIENDTDAQIHNNRIIDFMRGGIVTRGANNIFIEGNTISTTPHDVAPNGIDIGTYSGTSGTVEGNEISGCSWNGFTGDYEASWSGSGILVIESGDSLEIMGNIVHDCDVGMDIESDSMNITGNGVHNNIYGFVFWNAKPKVNYNDISSNTQYGVYRTTMGNLAGALDARYNWWGNQSGPYHPAINPTGLGDKVSDYVSFIPWLQVIHDVAVIDVAVSPTTVVAGQTVTINVTVKNEGSDYENFTVTVYYDSTAIASQNVTNLLPNWNTTLTFYWNTTGMARGNYTIKAVASTVPSEVNTANNVFIDGEVQVLWRDVAVTSVTADRTWVYQGFSANINVTVLNNGDFPETVTVTLYYNITANKIIGTQNVALLVGESKTIIFVWNTAGVEYCHNYTITAVATIPIDNNPADNTMADGAIKVRILGDTNGDGKVDIKDILAAAKAFGETPDRPSWDPNMDLNNDGKVNIKDILIIAKNYGKNCSP